jgi:hypothetical protein
VDGKLAPYALKVEVEQGLTAAQASLGADIATLRGEVAVVASNPGADSATGT